MKRIVEHIFLLLAVVFLSMSGLYYSLLEQSSPGATDEQYIFSVQQRVKEEMQVSSNELAKVVAILKTKPNPTFSELRIDARYPYFVFRNKQLEYWSDHRFIPDYARIEAITNPKLIDVEQSRYIVSHQRVRSGNDQVDVFSLVNVYRYYHSNNTYLKSGYNPNLFSQDPQDVVSERQKDFQAIYDNSSAFLFSVIPPVVDAYRNQNTPTNTVILATGGILFLGIYLIQLMLRLMRKRQYEWGFLCLAGYLLILRAVMLYFSVPFLFYDIDLFNPKYYASSVLVPSLGDLLVNTVFVVILAFYWVRHYYRSRSYMALLHLPSWVQLVLSVGCIVLSYTVFSLCYSELNNIYEKSQFTLDITLSIHFSFLKIVCLVVFITISFIYFLITHVLASLFLRFNRNKPILIGLSLILAGTILSAGVWLAIGGSLDSVFLLNGFYLVLIYISELPRSLYSFRYKTSSYLFLAALICAVMTSYVVYKQEIRKQLVHKQEFATQLLAENDQLGEFLMSKAQELIQKDADISRSLKIDTLFVRERIQHRVKNIHLDKYFDKYDIDVLSFQANGLPLDISPNAVPLATLTSRYRQAAYKTAYPGIYFVNEVGNEFVKQYLCFIGIPSNRPALTPGGSQSVSPPDTVGYVVLDLRLRNELPKSVYPELLVDTKFTQNPDIQNYSYALFSGPKLGGQSLGELQPRKIYGTGSYNYDRKFNLGILTNPALFTTGLTSNGYQHVAQRGQDGRIVVVSSEAYPFKNIFSNFSFLYLLLVVTVIVVIIGYAIKYFFSQYGINYSTKIQMLLNFAFFLPLALVILLISKDISSNYIDNQRSTYISNTRNIATNFLTYLDEHLTLKKRSKASMEEELAKIARDADLDINLFDTKGHLYTSTRPLIYESGYLSKQINPEAFIHIIEDKESERLLDESLGNKQYRTAYVAVKTYDGRLLGVLSIPYFYAQPELDRQIIEVTASALSVFSILFLIFLVLSYIALHFLIKPLKLLTQKIRKTNLEHRNEPLPWRTDDEIGLLIRAYNRMLVKLEENKQALAQTEKQSAWQEMAKQVAHEIKNPLTPMKLTLQHLQRTLPNQSNSANGNNDPARRIILRTFDSLLDQIDTLSDIATSFSDFAKMPLPKRETFEVTAVLNKTADLYADNPRLTLRRQIAKGPILTTGDRQMIGRIITNLIVNAIQSVPPSRKPVIELKLFINNDDVQIEIHDNGAGIPEAIQGKVFLPNFSTKQEGSGLGLAIAKRGVEHAGGTIWFETVEGVGTSFFISLPLEKVAEASVSKPVNY
ncbi:HAMP domain-containing histidine kinase [Spirosoma sp. BT702]|uniref:histidine kinase n=1 Tax=Spirosoma profusum TaxID=2771354 RepID=A0A926XX68_9BACT|nr:HAMP domain-containing sensor histidine kinase [Spirosoma profusum]MBD2701785.1 HAMP domain-containing histidine kinase [Spirosoma profusum]